MFSSEIPKSYRPGQHRWELIPECLPGPLAPPTKIYLRWIVPYRLPEALTVFCPDGQGRVFAHYMGIDPPDLMCLADFLDAIA